MSVPHPSPITVSVIGCGSIGLRHVRNMRGLGGVRILASDTDPRARSSAEALGATTFASLDRMLTERADAVLVCTPPSDHVSHAGLALDAGAHVMVEKPLASALEGARDLVERAERQGRLLVVGYNLRFDPGLALVRELVAAGAYGRLLAISVEFGQYLPDWRPGTDHRTGYTADPARGGGIVLDASHELDYMRWIAGEPESVYAVAATVGDLGIAAEDIAAIVLRLRSGAIGEAHLDCLQRAYSRSCKVVATEGTIEWEFPASVRAYSAASGQWAPLCSGDDRNASYVAELRHFLDLARDGGEPLVSGRDGLRTLEVALAVRRSAAERREIAIDPL